MHDRLLTTLALATVDATRFAETEAVERRSSGGRAAVG
jgi:hypothetical protein